MRTSREACAGWGAVELSFLGATLQVSTHAPSTCTDIPTPRAGSGPVRARCVERQPASSGGGIVGQLPARPGADSRAAPAGPSTHDNSTPHLAQHALGKRFRAARVSPLESSGTARRSERERPLDSGRGTAQRSERERPLNGTPRCLRPRSVGVGLAVSSSPRSGLIVPDGFAPPHAGSWPSGPRTGSTLSARCAAAS